jgi:hypothetical protein
VDLEFGNRQKETVTKANGQTIDSMEKALLNTKTAFTKDNFRIF